MNDKDSIKGTDGRAIERTQKELCKKAKDYAATVQKYSVRESRWSGRIVLDDEKCFAEGIAGRKLWSCDILLKAGCQDRTIIHEHLHACSGSYLNPISYIRYGKMEEASVEMLAREICIAEDIPFTPNKNKNVDTLYQINDITKICESNLDFATALFAKDIKRRYNWLEQKVAKAIEQNNFKADYENELFKLLNKLKGHK